jgi:hypothetical protein
VAALRTVLVALAGLLIGVASPALAADPIEEAQLARLDELRAEVADQVQLAAYDLVDELVWTWMSEPPFDEPTPVVLAGVTVPVGLGTGLQALVENHLAKVLASNPSSRVQLAHCPACTAVVVHSGPEGTVISRGVDNPATLAELGADTGRHALFVDVEAEGSWLVLRARITRLEPALPIVWSHTIASSSSAAPLLRHHDPLVSAEQARKEYLQVLKGDGHIAIPVRLVIRSYAQPGDRGGVPPPPFLWLQSGVELSGNSKQAWVGSMVVGYSFIPQAYQGILGQARLHRLLFGRSRALNRPDLYLTFGAAAISVWGAATASFRDDKLTVDEILRDSEAADPRTIFGALHLGLDLRLGHRIGMSAFLETIPSLRSSNNLGSFLTVGNVEAHTIGTEVSVCF